MVPAGGQQIIHNRYPLAVGDGVDVDLDRV